MESVAMQYLAQTAVANPAARRISQPMGPQGLSGDLLVELAHDLRSPMTSIMTLAEHLQRGISGPVTERQRRQLGIIYSAALCLSQTATGIVELERGSNGSESESPGPFSLAEVLAGAAAIVAPMAEEKRLELRIDIQGPDRRLGPAGILGRVLLNLATNAVKFTEEGRVVLAASACGSDLVELSVCDTGPGVVPELMRLNGQLVPLTACRRYSSYGLGLAMCHRLLTALGAVLEVDSSPGVGTRFSFTLRLPELRLGQDPPQSSRRSA